MRISAQSTPIRFGEVYRNESQLGTTPSRTFKYNNEIYYATGNDRILLTRAYEATVMATGDAKTKKENVLEMFKRRLARKAE